MLNHIIKLTKENNENEAGPSDNQIELLSVQSILSKQYKYVSIYNAIIFNSQ